MFDIDGTICTDTDGEYHYAKPFIERIEYINSLYDNNNKIIFYTGRGSNSGKDWKKITMEQLNTWGVKYHKLIFGKPSYDLYIGNKTINSDRFFSMGEEFL